jgi:hypothetical protein
MVTSVVSGGVPVTVERSFGLVLASMGRQDTVEASTG